MISALACTEEKPEKELILATLRDIAARLTEDQWDIKSCETIQEAEKLLDSRPLIDLACCNVSREEALEWIERFRKVYRESKLLVIADSKMSPMNYLRPQIMASSLLLKPYSAVQMAVVMEEFIRAYLEEGEDESQCLIVKSREGRLVIPYSRIYYMEAREKKVFLRLLNEEYAIYETLENIHRELPGYFIRTHRSFLVNSRMIQKIRLSDGIVTLRDNFTVPASRGYRAELKGLVI